MAVFFGGVALPPIQAPVNSPRSPTDQRLFLSGLHPQQRDPRQPQLPPQASWNEKRTPKVKPRPTAGTFRRACAWITAENHPRRPSAAPVPVPSGGGVTWARRSVHPSARSK